tara:strand:- start:21990 stop:22715 length:726 start_codon:yes stop_codon:yes gene_type:complete
LNKKFSSRSAQINQQKQDIAEMFDQISDNYDFLNRLFSFRFDVYWRRSLVKGAKLQDEDFVLDLATGTGDLAFAIKRHKPDVRVVGTDVAKKMLIIAKEKAKMKSVKIDFCQKKVNFLPFEQQSFDHVFISFGVRNFANIHGELQEVYRVLRPKGRIHIVDFFQQQSSVGKMFINLYVSVLMPSIVALFYKNKSAYNYLPNSIKTFYKSKKFKEIVSNCGFKFVEERKLSFGLCEIVRFEK